MSEPIAFLSDRVVLHPGDCAEVLRALPDNSVDSCVTDPPYHLTSIVKRFGAENAAPAKVGKTGAYARASAGFMGKQWDGGDIAFRPELWAEVLRVLKPGTYVVAFASTRGFGRMSVAIEDAGFITHPLIAWLFASGFPKATRLTACAMDGPFAGVDVDGYRYGGQALKPAIEPIYLGQKPFSEETGTANVLRWGTGALNINGCRIEGFKPEVGRWPANLITDGSDEVIAAFPASKGQQGAVTGNEPSSKANAIYGQFDGRPATIPRGDAGSAARFFFSAKAGHSDRISRIIEEVTVEWISEKDLCQATLQVDTEQLHAKGIAGSASTANSDLSTFLSGSNITDLCRTASECIIKTATSSTMSSATWNWLMRLLTSASIAVARCETQDGGSHAENAGSLNLSLTIILGKTASLPGASRAASGTPLKISVSARRHGHPTVKPVDLMRWLVRLVTPPGGITLDPFAGTGTTGEAAWREGMQAILIEREPAYQADIARRMELCLAGPEERARASIKARFGQLPAGPLFSEAAE